MSQRSTSSATSAPLTGALPLWAAACFFASGAAGLLYEIVWSKQLAYVLGSSLHAVATVAAAFLGGLAIGARVLGVPLARRGNGARTYALLELGVAVLGVALLPLLRGLEPVFGAAYRAFGGDSFAFGVARFALAFVALLPPTVLMGATLPVLVGRFEGGLVGAALARLYALNTFGAVAGSALGGFVLLPGVGLTASTFVAAAINVAVAGIAWIAGGTRPSPVAPAAAAAAVAAPVEGAGGGGRALVAVLFATSGFAALVFQIAWVRLFSLVFGSSVYSFAGVLGVYLCGLALGSTAISFVLRRGANLMTFARLQLALGVAAAFAMHGFSRLPDQMLSLVTRAGEQWSVLFMGQLALVATLLVVPCALLGAIFPVATRLLQAGDGGEAAGDAYAVNTAGTIAGSLAGGFLLVPMLGVQGTHVAALALSCAIGIAAWGGAAARRSARAGDGVLVLVAAVVAFGLVWTAPAWQPSVMSAGSFRPARANQLTLLARSLARDPSAAAGSTPVQLAMSTERVLYYREGENGSVLVGTDAADSRRWLKVGGKVDASTDDMETQVMLGLLPAALADSGARTLVIGLGSGYTLAAALAAGAGRTDVAELERGVVEASEFFHEPGRNPLRDPRVTLAVEDARTLLEHSADRYDLIISEPSNPWLAGVNNLFTVDFYRRVRERLAPDGVFCQWMQLYEISPETMRSMIASYLEVFPEGEVFTIWRAVDVLLVASPGGRSIALDRLRTPEARRMLDVAHVAAPEDVAGYWSAPVSALRPLARGATLNRDDRPIVEYRAPRDLVAMGRATLGRRPPTLAMVPFEPRRSAGPRFAAWSREGWHEHRGRQLIALADTAHARLAIAHAREDGFGALADRLAGEVDAALRRRTAEEAIAAAQQNLSVGQRSQARALLERATRSDPGFGKGWLLLADQLRVAKEFDAAETALTRVVPADSIEAGDVEILSGMLRLARGDTTGALSRMTRAQQFVPANPTPYLFEASLRLARNDEAGAQGAIQRGLARSPNDERLLRGMATVSGAR